MSKKSANPVLGINEKPSLPQWILLSFQHLFAMFGATILVPILVDLSPSIALISSGLGTLAFIIVTRGQVPSYLGSSFAFIAPVIAAKEFGGPGAAMVGTFLAGLVYGIIALLMKKFGIKWLMNLLPPIVVGPVIAVIGLSLSGTAVNQAMNIDGTYSSKHMLIALATLIITIVASTVFKGFFRIIPILIGIVSGYIISIFAGIVNFDKIKEADWFYIPDFIFPFADYTPELSWKIALLMVPVAVVTIAEHIGHQMVLSNVVGKDLLKKPGLHASLFGDGLSTMIAGLIGGVPTTTYGENIGVLAITRVYSIYVFIGAAVFAIAFGFIEKVAEIIHSIPNPVLGGVSILLFGIIASSGLKMLVDEKIDFNDRRNLIIASVILVLGIGGAVIEVGSYVHVEGMALSAIMGVILNQVLPGKPKVQSDIFEKEVVNK